MMTMVPHRSHAMKSQSIQLVLLLKADSIPGMQEESDRYTNDSGVEKETQQWV